MNEQPFNNLVQRIRNAYGLKQYPDEVLGFLYEECGQMESGSAKFVFDDILMTYDKFPTRLHLAINGAWGKWNFAKGERGGKKKNAECHINAPAPDGSYQDEPCNQGMLFLYHQEHSCGFYPAAFVCDDCKRCDCSWPVARLSEMLQRGWRLNPLKTSESRPSISGGVGDSMKGMVNNWGRHQREHGRSENIRRDVYGDE